MTELERKIKQNALNYIEKFDIDKMSIPDCEIYRILIPYTTEGIRSYAIDRLVYSTSQKKFIAVEYYLNNGESDELKKIEL